MDKLRPILQREFGDFVPVHSFEAGIPVYLARLVVEILEPQELSHFALYMLHAIALDVNTRLRIAALLGVEDRDLATPGAELLSIGFIEHGLPSIDGSRSIIITAKGRQSLSEQGPPPVPQRKNCRLHFNAVTWTPISLEKETWSVERMGKEGLFLLPMKQHERLTLGDFTEDDVATALSDNPDFQKSEVTALLELRKVEKQYIAPVTVVVLQHQHTGEQQLVIYRNYIQLRPESIELQRLFESGSFKLPTDVNTFKERGLDLPISLDTTTKEVTQQLVHAEYVISDLETELVIQEETQKEVQQTSPQELEGQLERIQQLKDEIRIKRQEGEELRQRLRENQVEFLQTEQHRGVLERALCDAKEEVIIISPWMNRRACNDDLCRLMANAVARGVCIRIGYGMGRERDADEAARNRSNTQQVKNTLNRLLPPALSHLLEMRETSGTHQKILICDRTFAVTGSFNWLSYVGKQDEGYRNETGTLFYAKQQVMDLAAIALKAFSS
jgi:hypothetical protein